jgi:nicotinate-nucleotide adenylyltransferase
MRRLLGLLGGTFNPIHNGHLHLAGQLLEQLHFDEIHFIPSAAPPLKIAPEVSAQDRAEMVKLAIAGNPKFTLDLRELTRDGKSYTTDTLISLRGELGQAVSLCLLMGYDAFLGLPKWHCWQALLNYAHIVVVNRPQASQEPSDELRQLLEAHKTGTLSALLDAASGAIYFAEIPPLDISSTAIRARLASGQSVDTMIPADVLGYIRQHHLYETP